MKLVLGVVTKISSQRSATRLLSAIDKATVDECDRQMALACGIFGVRNPSTSSQFAQIFIFNNQIRFELCSSHNKPLLVLRPS